MPRILKGCQLGPAMELVARLLNSGGATVGRHCTSGGLGSEVRVPD
jgi:hypothetical protein